jgi:hypothetical protein
MLESTYQSGLIGRIHERFPGSFILKNDEQYLQGIEDLTVLFPGGFWALLEVKPRANAPHRPNQDYYIELHDSMCFARFIYPENEEAVLNELEAQLQHHWQARVS